MSIEALKHQRTMHRNEKKTYEKRKDSVSKTASNVSKLNVEIENVNKKIGDCAEHLQNAIRGIPGIEAIASAISGEKEQTVDMDANMAECRSHLNAEVDRCENRIEVLETSIDNLTDRINEERRKSLMALLTGGN